MLDERMRTHGTLIKWNDDKGFGFAVQPQSHEEIFVHISAFPRDGMRPRVGETISFEVRTTADGRKRAEVVERPGSRKASAKRKVSKSARRGSLVGFLLTVAAVIALCFAAYNSRQETRAALADRLAAETASQFRCDGRTHCSQMTSCTEARYFSKHCPGMQMDGDGDGEPCEQQWCN